VHYIPGLTTPLSTFPKISTTPDKLTFDKTGILIIGLSVLLIAGKSSNTPKSVLPLYQEASGFLVLSIIFSPVTPSIAVQYKFS